MPSVSVIGAAGRGGAGCLFASGRIVGVGLPELGIKEEENSKSGRMGDAVCASVRACVREYMDMCICLCM